MVLAETTGTDTIRYLHGLDLVAQSDGVSIEYFAYDGLGSVRQVLDAAGLPLMAQTFDPYGNLYAYAGPTESVTHYGYTGEQTDSNGLVFLRARYYAPSMGRFGQMDPSRLENNPYLYGLGNPVRYTDPSGLTVDCAPWDYCPPAPDEVTVGDVLVNFAKRAYSKDGSLVNCANHPDNGQSKSDSVADLFQDFVCEYGPSERQFDHEARLTQELARSRTIAKLRWEFYVLWGGIGYKSQRETQMNIPAFLDAKLLDPLIGGYSTVMDPFTRIPVTITDFLGGYGWDIHVTSRGTARFEIVNETSLESGTRIGFSAHSRTDISVQLYLSNPDAYPSSQYNIISILSPKPRDQRNPSTTTGLGGGTMTQRFIWEERNLADWECNPNHVDPFFPYQLWLPDNTVLPAF